MKDKISGDIFLQLPVRVLLQPAFAGELSELFTLSNL